MERYNINDRLYSDLVSYITGGVHVLSQENQINAYNTHKVRGWQGAMDAYKIVNSTGNYDCDFVYDLGFSNEKRKIKPLIFKSYNGSSGKNFLDFILSLYTADSSTFIRANGLESVDLREKLSEIKELYIYNTEIDSLLISLIPKYLPKIKVININNCLIKSQCNFCEISCEVNISNTSIENIRSFNDCESNILFDSPSIISISPTTFNSKKISFKNCKNTSLKEIFLKCNFSKLKNASFSPRVTTILENYSHEDALLFLPFSAPILEELYIEGKVKDFDFLRYFSKLCSINIASSYDDFGAYHAEITDKKKKEYYKITNINDYKILKILEPKLSDDAIVSIVELNRIKKIITFNNRISYTDQEKIRLLKGGNSVQSALLNSLKDGLVENYYELHRDELIYTNASLDRKILHTTGESLMKMGDFIFVEVPSENFIDIKAKRKKEVVISPKYIYNVDGKPIILMNIRRKKIKNEQDAHDEVKRGVLYNETKSDAESIKEQYLEHIKWLKENDSHVTVGNLIDILEIEGLNVTSNYFKSLNINGYNICGILEKKERLDDSSAYKLREIIRYQEEINQLIKKYYHDFTFPEKVVLYYNNMKYGMCNSPLYIMDIYKMTQYYDESLINSIDRKTNGEYLKLFGLLKMKYLCYKNIENLYQMEIPKEYIKKLKI